MFSLMQKVVRLLMMLMFEVISVGFMVVQKIYCACNLCCYWNRQQGGIRLQTYPNTGIVPYDYPSAKQNTE